MTRIILLFLFVKIISSIMYCFVSLDFQQIWRQTDTLGVSLRYYLRWTQDTNTPFFVHFLPAILQSGDSNGIMAMEFPILNIITAPFFYFGPYWGRVFTGLFIVIIVTFAIFYNASIWRKINILAFLESPIGSTQQNRIMFNAMLLFPIFSFATYFTWRFMPDFLSVIFCYIAIGLSWNTHELLNNRKRVWRFIFVFILSTVGLLLKPTSIICFFILLLHPKFLKLKTWPDFIKQFSWLALSVLITLLYYTKGVEFISSFAQNNTIFAIEMRPPLLSFLNFLDIKKLFKLFNSQSFYPNAFIVLFVLTLWHFMLKKKIIGWQLWCIALMQILTIGILDGTHAYVHYYYFIGSAPIFSLIFIFYLTYFKNILSLTSYKILTVLLMCLYVGRFYDNVHFDVKNIFRDHTKWSSDYASCKQIKSNHPEIPWDSNYVFRTNFEDYPRLGVCFGERTNSKMNKYGFYLTNELPKNCTQLDSAGKYILAQCT